MLLSSWLCNNIKPRNQIIKSRSIHNYYYMCCVVSTLISNACQLELAGILMPSDYSLLYNSIMQQGALDFLSTVGLDDCLLLGKVES